MYPPLLELWTIALSAAESAIAAAVRAHVFTPRDATAARSVVARDLRWLSVVAGR